MFTLHAPLARAGLVGRQPPAQRRLRARARRRAAAPALLALCRSAGCEGARADSCRRCFASGPREATPHSVQPHRRPRCTASTPRCSGSRVTGCAKWSKVRPLQGCLCAWRPSKQGSPPEVSPLPSYHTRVWRALTSRPEHPYAECPALQPQSTGLQDQRPLADAISPPPPLPHQRGLSGALQAKAAGALLARCLARPGAPDGRHRARGYKQRVLCEHGRVGQEPIGALDVRHLWRARARRNAQERPCRGALLKPGAERAPICCI